MVRVTTSIKTGSANTAFVVPASTTGKHRVSAIGNKGSSTYTNWFTTPSAFVSAGTPEPGLLVRVQVRGFAAGETVEAAFGSQAGQVLGSVIASGTGSGSVAVRMPLDAEPGAHNLWLIGNQGGVAMVALMVTATSAPTPTGTPTAEPTLPVDTPTETDEAATETPTEPVPTPTATGTQSVVDATPVG